VLIKKEGWSNEVLLADGCVFVGDCVVRGALVN